MLIPRNKKNPTNNANNIRTNLLIYVHNELISNQNNNILINSKHTDTYCKKFENYVIVERDTITSSEKEYKILKERDELPLFLVKLNLNENIPVILKTKKIKLTKNPNKNHSLDSCELYKNKDKKQFENNIRYLRTFSHLLKSNTPLFKKQDSINKYKSTIKRRKKYCQKDSCSKLKFLLNIDKEENQIKFQKVRSDKNYINKYKSDTNIMLLKAIQENRNFLTKTSYRREDIMN